LGDYDPETGVVSIPSTGKCPEGPPLLKMGGKIAML